MHKAHKIQLSPTKAQEIFFKKSCGVARFSFNWALDKWKTDYANGIKQSAYTLIKHLNSIKKTEFKWMQETGKCAPQYAIHNVEAAYKKMWKEKSGYPKFKKKGIKDSFVAIENEISFKQSDFRIHIPRLGKVKCCENLRFEGKVLFVTVKRIADKWFAVVQIETPNEASVTYENQVVIGVDLGIKTLATCSNGKVFENPKALKSNLKSLKRSQRSLSRKVKGSSNRKKQQILLAKKYYRVSCIRKNALHQATAKIVNSANVIIVEDLSVNGMIKNRNLSQAIGDVGFGEFRRQIEYKAAWQNKTVIIADRFFASSKTCSCCGLKKEKLNLSERTFCCLSCGLTIDRDLNAAINLANYSPTSKGEGSKACGERVVETQNTSVKHEIVNKIENYSQFNTL